MSDDTTQIPLVIRDDRDPPRWLMVALAVSYTAAGAVLTFSCLVLAHAADQITNAPICRRL